VPPYTVFPVVHDALERMAEANWEAIDRSSRRYSSNGRGRGSA
jgi:hypothetical protein